MIHAVVEEKTMINLKARFKAHFTAAAIFLCVGILNGAEVVGAEIIEGPVDLLKRTSNEVIKILRDKRDQIKEEPGLVYKVVDDFIVPHLDDVTMAKLALGKNWRKADNKQKIEFVDEFRMLLIRTYGKSLQEFSDERIIFFPLNAAQDAKKVIVKSEVVRSNGPKIPVSYRMRLKGNAWKVYDINIDGVSLVTSYRGTFAQEMRKGGVIGLLKMLREKNSKVNIDVPSSASSQQDAS
jgi:phospholipid transport system substrate-binding protein